MVYLVCGNRLFNVSTTRSLELDCYPWDESCHVTACVTGSLTSTTAGFYFFTWKICIVVCIKSAINYFVVIEREYTSKYYPFLITLTYPSPVFYVFNNPKTNFEDSQYYSYDFQENVKLRKMLKQLFSVHAIHC